MHYTIGNLNATTIAATQLLGSSANDLAESHDSDRGLSRVHGEDNRYLPLGNMLPRPPASACSLSQSFPWCGWSCSSTEFQQRRRGPGRDSAHWELQHSAQWSRHLPVAWLAVRRLALRWRHIHADCITVEERVYERRVRRCKNWRWRTRSTVRQAWVNEERPDWEMERQQAPPTRWSGVLYAEGRTFGEA